MTDGTPRPHFPHPSCSMFLKDDNSCTYRPTKGCDCNGINGESRRKDFVQEQVISLWNVVMTMIYTQVKNYILNKKWLSKKCSHDKFIEARGHILLAYIFIPPLITNDWVACEPKAYKIYWWNRASHNLLKDLGGRGGNQNENKNFRQYWPNEFQPEAVTGVWN